MELRPGCKHTEHGPIPAEWQTLTLGALEERGDIKLYRGNVISRKDINRDPGDYPIYSSSVHSNGLFGCYEHYMFDEELITWSVDGGGHFFYRPKHRFSVTNVCGYLRIRTPSIDYRFFAYHLQYLHSRKAFDYTLKAHPSVIRSAYTVALPSITEQRAIAAALSDVDALISALDKLIAKKCDIKQAAMQQLLTGKKKLPGFSGEWEMKKLGEITEIVSGGTPSTTVDEYWNGDINWCTPTDITRTQSKYLTNTEKRISKAGLQNSSANLLPIGALLLCSRATIGEVKIAANVVCTNQGFKSFVCQEDVSNEFLYYTLLTIKPKLIEKAIGSTFLEISKKDTASIEIHVPELSEQQAIAAVLSDMDAEISALERKRNKTHALKQGMMQELLTGRTRLV